MRNRTSVVAVLGLLTLFALLAYVAWPVPRPYLRRVPLTIETVGGPVHLTVELASTAREQEQGLMYRQRLAADSGMLFDLHSDQRVALWMKNTLIPLDLIFIKSDGTISAIAANAKPLSLKPVRSRERVRAVLEISGGRSAELGLKPGNQVLSEIFGNAQH